MNDIKENQRLSQIAHELLEQGYSIFENSFLAQYEPNTIAERFLTFTQTPETYKKAFSFATSGRLPTHGYIAESEREGFNYLSTFEQLRNFHKIETHENERRLFSDMCLVHDKMTATGKQIMLELEKISSFRWCDHHTNKGEVTCGCLFPRRTFSNELESKNVTPLHVSRLVYNHAHTKPKEIHCDKSFLTLYWYFSRTGLWLQSKNGKIYMPQYERGMVIAFWGTQASEATFGAVRPMEHGVLWSLKPRFTMTTSLYLK